MIVLCICGGDIKGYYIIFTITKRSYSGKQGLKEIKKSILFQEDIDTTRSATSRNRQNTWRTPTELYCFHAHNASMKIWSGQSPIL